MATVQVNNFQIHWYREDEVKCRVQRGSKGDQRLNRPTDGRRWTLPSNPVLLLRRFQRAFTARLATHSKVESPSSRLRIPNSTSREPAPAVQVSLLLSGGTPVFRLTWDGKNQKLCGRPHDVEQLYSSTHEFKAKGHKLEATWLQSKFKASLSS